MLDPIDLTTTSSSAPQSTKANHVRQNHWSRDSEAHIFLPGGDKRKVKSKRLVYYDFKAEDVDGYLRAVLRKTWERDESNSSLKKLRDRLRDWPLRDALVIGESVVVVSSTVSY